MCHSVIYISICTESIHYNAYRLRRKGMIIHLDKMKNLILEKEPRLSEDKIR